MVTDDARIRASLPTLTELLDRGASIVAASHLGRPRGHVDEALRLGAVAELLRSLLDRVVEYVPTDGVLSPEVEQSCQALAFEPGRLVLENLRFDPGEEANDRAFAQRLAGLADLYVDDAFGAVHRAHASVVALPAVVREQGGDAAGRLLQREVEALSRLVADPARPTSPCSGRQGLGQARHDRRPRRTRGRAPDRWGDGVHVPRRGRRLGGKQPDRARSVRRGASRSSPSRRARRRPAAARGRGRRHLQERGGRCPATRSSQVPTGEMGLDIGPGRSRSSRGRSPTRRRSCGTGRWASSSSSRSRRDPRGGHRDRRLERVRGRRRRRQPRGREEVRARGRVRPPLDGRGRFARVHRGRELPASPSWRWRRPGARDAPIIAANWKMHKTHLEAIQAVQKLLPAGPGRRRAGGGGDLSGGDRCARCRP